MGKDEITPLNQVSFKLETGDFATVVGPNGAGKTTLLNVIAGVFPCDSGTISLNNVDLTNYPEHKRSRFIARAFQNPNNNLALSMTIEQHFSMAISGYRAFNLHRGVTSSVREKFFDQLIGLNMGLEKKIKDPVGTLSGGQKQALVLLMAVMRKPDLLLLDESTAGLDPHAAELLLQLIQKLVLDNKFTTLMVTHNVEHSLRYGNRLLMLHQGTIILDLDQETKRNTTSKDLIARYKQKTGRKDINNNLLWNEL
jgi:putative tryptophan/tyrosine transport system ATP-binding protein